MQRLSCMIIAFLAITLSAPVARADDASPRTGRVASGVAMALGGMVLTTTSYVTRLSLDETSRSIPWVVPGSGIYTGPLVLFLTATWPGGRDHVGRNVAYAGAHLLSGFAELGGIALVVAGIVRATSETPSRSGITVLPYATANGGGLSATW